MLSVSQKQAPGPDRKSQVLATFADGEPAIVKGPAGNGMIYSVGFLPALDYIRQAIVARRTLQENQEKPAAEQDENPTPALELSGGENPETAADPRLERSYNPWEFSAEVRELILQPVRDAKVDPPLICSVPLVDAVLLYAGKGIVIPLANYTLASLEGAEFQVRTERPIDRVESVRHGRIEFNEEGSGRVRFSLPLEASDYVKLYYR